MTDRWFVWVVLTGCVAVWMIYVGHSGAKTFFGPWWPAVCVLSGMAIGIVAARIAR